MVEVDASGFDAVDHAMMAEALRLAHRGLWTTEPNPRVGCVIARGERIVGRGFHARAGQPHAEARALADAGRAARGATAYVTLEPCSHHGRTPPCADALIDAGIARLVCAGSDPHPSVAGEGIRRLERAGIEVRTGLMAAAARALNPGFFHRFERGRPWVRAKLAGSLDGRSAGPDGRSQWITGQPARRDGHRWRARAGAILTGIETILADDPRLDVRIDGFDRMVPVVICDSRARLPEDARVLGTGAPVLQACTVEATTPGCDPLRLPPGRDGRVRLETLLETLAMREINELHVEAGPTLTGALLASGLVDELVVYQASCLVGADGDAMVRLPGIETLDSRIRLEPVQQRRFGDDWRLILVPAGDG